jgi:hypothetical protein
MEFTGNIDELVSKIFTAIYWDSPSDQQCWMVKKIIEHNDNSDDIATAICDALGIERRFNRKEIRNVLNQQEQ